MGGLGWWGPQRGTGGLLGSCPSLPPREENSGCSEMRVTNLPRPPGDFPSSGRSTFLQNLDTGLRILLFPTSYSVSRASLVGQTVKKSACNVGDWGSIPGSARCPGEGNGNPLQYSCLENPKARGAWRATVRGAAKSQTRLKLLTHIA